MKDLLSAIGKLPPLAQIPIVILLFLAAAALVLFLIEIAPRKGRTYTIIRAVACILIPVAVFLLLGSVWWAAAVAAVLGGVFFVLDYRQKEGTGYLFALAGFLAPAFVLLVIGLVYPTIQTLINSFLSSRGNFIGFDNFVWIFSSENNLVTIRNTIIWVLVVPIVSTAIGLAYAVFIDRSRGERFFKALVFMPMAISFVGASIIFRFIYAYREEGQSQYGLLNQIVVWFGGSPVNWLQQVPLNSFLLMVVLIWVQTGFAMVILSAAIKGVPAEQMEAAQLDGTNAWQRFWNVTIPGISSSLVVVITTISIASLKVFDIVRTMGMAYPDTGVIANDMVSLLQNFETGRSSAFAVILFLLVLPIVIFNARQIQKQREIR
ncbi:carbohydrate ABC transporter permease [Homoserinibacter sp. YIM 151385]|uniref:carbohydrate ABC transporter permease n=1 Tax=Homoserinibacter sp. YIM 151385 TaxID=2985506 RepID=UPI0022F074EC|nr:sugar ABC transporter permease [Homoserinibacter sp. YIM 151385]WBU36926.1 sugar ABC transporter permease [Homoserinibacter sp. YIM 151385]